VNFILECNKKITTPIEEEINDNIDISKLDIKNESIIPILKYALVLFLNYFGTFMCFPTLFYKGYNYTNSHIINNVII